MSAAKTGATDGPPELSSHASPAKPGSDRSFGIVFAAVFAVIGLLPLFTAGYVRAWALAVSAAFLAAAVVRPSVLAPLNRFWLRVGLLLNRIVSPVALFIVYCVAVLPTALVLRALGKDPLRRHLDAQVKSYWIERTPPGRSDAQMKKQF
jgi:hypothetical protein